MKRPRPHRRLAKFLRGEGILQRLAEASSNEADVHGLVGEVNHVLGGNLLWSGLSDHDGGERAATIVRNLLSNFVASLDPARAVAVTHEQTLGVLQDLDSKLSESSEAVQSLAADQLVAAGVGRLAATRDRLNRLPPIVRRPLENALRTEPEALTRLVAAVVDSGKPPAEVLKEWISQPPTVLGTLQEPLNLETWASIGELSAAYGLDVETATAFVIAAQGGVAHAAYYRARAAWAALQSERTADALTALGDVEQAVNDVHPLVRAVARFAVWEHEGQGDPAPLAAFRKDLRGWRPADDVERDIRARLAVLVELHDASMGLREQYNAALASVEDALRSGHLDDLAFIASRLLNARVTAGVTVNRSADLARAIGLATGARDAYRLYRRDTRRAVREAVAAAQLAGESRLALKLGLEPPRGEALALEAAYPPVFQSVLLAALGLGDSELTADLSRRTHDELEDGFVRRWCIAMLKDQLSPSEGARVESGERTRLWQEALEAATDDDERRQALQGLAFAGASELPGIDCLVEAWQAAEWRARAALLRGDPEEAVRLVHPHRLASPSAADALADAYRVMGKTDAAAEVLINAARVFDHDRLRIVAAHTYLQANRLAEAEAVLDECLRTAATSWSQRGEALRLLGDLQANRGAWAEATDSWAASLEADSSSVDTRWRLAEGFAKRGSLDAAWQALTDDPDRSERRREPPPPRQARDVYLATFLAVRLADPHWAVEQALTWIEEFGEDQEITGKVLTLLLAAGGLDRRWTRDPSAEEPPVTAPLPADLQLRLTAAVDAFCDAHPDSEHLLRFQGSIEHLIDEVNRAARPTETRANLLRKLLLQVLRGEVPLGVLAAAAPRPYAQVVATHDGGVLSARGDDAEHEQCVATALDAMGVRVPDGASGRGILPGRAIPTVAAVLDATSLFALSVLPEERRGRCVGSVGSVILADEAYVDLRAARDALALDSPGTWTVDPETGEGHLIPLSPAVLERQRERMQAMWRLAEACSRRPTPNDGPPELAEVGGEQFGASLAGIRIAVTSSAVVWSDDVALRQLARHFGAAAFSTLAMVEAHAALGSLSPDEMESTIRCFMREGIGDFAPNADRLVTLASDPDGRAGVVSAMSKPRFWADPMKAIAPLLKLVDVVSDSPHDVHDLVHSSALGVARTHLPDGLVEATIAAIVARALLVVGPTGHAPRLLGAVRAAIHEGRRSLEDPLRSAANLVMQTLEASLGPQLAADSVRGFVGNCSDDDRSVVARVILQPPPRPRPEG